MKKLTLVVIVLLVVIIPLLALENHSKALPDLTEDQWNSLLAGNTIEADTLDGGTIMPIMPVGSKAYETAKGCQESDNSFTVACASLIKYPEIWQGIDTQLRQLKIFNTVRQISTMEGTTYISHSAGDKPKVFVTDSYYLSDPKNKKSVLSDPIAVKLPSSVSSYVFMDDTSFGGNVYTHTYSNTAEEIFVDVTNYTPMKVLGLVTALKAGKLSIYIATEQLEEGIYLTAMGKITDREPEITVLWKTVHLPSAFMTRITAMKQWLVDRISMLNK